MISLEDDGSKSGMCPDLSSPGPRTQHLTTGDILKKEAARIV